MNTKLINHLSKNKIIRSHDIGNVVELPFRKVIDLGASGLFPKLYYMNPAGFSVSEVSAWLGAWQSGFQGDSLAECTAEIMADNRQDFPMFERGKNPSDGLKSLFPSYAVLIDTHFPSLENLVSGRIYSLYIPVSKPAFTRLEKRGRYWMLSIYSGGFWTVALYEI